MTSERFPDRCQASEVDFDCLNSGEMICQFSCLPGGHVAGYSCSCKCPPQYVGPRCATPASADSYIPNGPEIPQLPDGEYILNGPEIPQFPDGVYMPNGPVIQ